MINLQVYQTDMINVKFRGGWISPVSDRKTVSSATITRWRWGRHPRTRTTPLIAMGLTQTVTVELLESISRRSVYLPIFNNVPSSQMWLRGHGAFWRPASFGLSYISYVWLRETTRGYKPLQVSLREFVIMKPSLEQIARFRRHCKLLDTMAPLYN